MLGFNMSPQVWFSALNTTLQTLSSSIAEIRHQRINNIYRNEEHIGHHLLSSSDFYFQSLTLINIMVGFDMSSNIELSLGQIATYLTLIVAIVCLNDVGVGPGWNTRLSSVFHHVILQGNPVSQNCKTDWTGVTMAGLNMPSFYMTLYVEFLIRYVATLFTSPRSIRQLRHQWINQFWRKFSMKGYSQV